MAPGNFETLTPNEDNEDKKTPENQAETEMDQEEGDAEEKKEYKISDYSSGQNMTQLRDELDPEIVKKLEDMKKRDQEDEDDNEPLDKAA